MKSYLALIPLSVTLRALDVGLEPRLDPEEPVAIAVDATGIKVADRGEWIQAKWKRCRGFLKIHLAVDVETKQIVAMEVTEERTGDGVTLELLVEQGQRHCNVAWVLADGAYDSRHNFQYLDESGIEHGIKVRRNSSRRAKGCHARKMAFMEQLGDSEAWKWRIGHGGGGWLRPCSPSLNGFSVSMSWREAFPIWFR